LLVVIDYIYLEILNAETLVTLIFNSHFNLYFIFPTKKKLVLSLSLNFVYLDDIL